MTNIKLKEGLQMINLNNIRFRLRANKRSNRVAYWNMIFTKHWDNLILSKVQ